MVIDALPHTVTTAVEQAVGETDPVPTAVSNPLALMVATVVGVPAGNDQVTVVATPASALTAADIWSVEPTGIVTPLGATLMLWTVAAGGGAGGCTVTSSPHAATPAATSPDQSRER
jgi:hypothetical protein